VSRPVSGWCPAWRSRTLRLLVKSMRRQVSAHLVAALFACFIDPSNPRGSDYAHLLWIPPMTNNGSYASPVIEKLPASDHPMPNYAQKKGPHKEGLLPYLSSVS
jgi:hypothetical protein